MNLKGYAFDLLDPETCVFRDAGLLLLRLFFGTAMAIAHGYGILTSFSTYADQFPNPIGLGGPTSMVLMIFAEFFCSIAIVLGFMTRLALVPLLIGLSVAFFIYHGGHSFDKRELAYLYLSAFAVLMLTGPGRFSVDALVFRRGKQEEIA